MDASEQTRFDTMYLQHQRALKLQGKHTGANTRVGLERMMTTLSRLWAERPA